MQSGKETRRDFQATATRKTGWVSETKGFRDQYRLPLFLLELRLERRRTFGTTRDLRRPRLGVSRRSKQRAGLVQNDPDRNRL